MIRVGFLCTYSKDWMGGVNYIKNLLFALTQLPKGQVIPLVFVGRDADPIIKSSFAPYAQVVETSILTTKSIDWWIWKISKKLFSTDLWVEWRLRSHRIDVYSHSNLYRTFFTRSINWFPDFQHIRLPQMFDQREIKQRNDSFRKSARFATLIMLSSKDAQRDFAAFAPAFAQKGRVLNFVAQPKRALLASDPASEEAVLKKLELPARFFYLPNQFWKHKNHQVVFEALAILKAKGVDVFLVCSGNMKDYRNESYSESLKKYVDEHSLSVRFLGLIDYDEVIVLMKRAVSVINPSLFEGWSSTVEECKAIGKALILSDIPVHREQDPEGASFFNPNQPDELASIIERVWLTSVPTPRLSVDLEKRTLEFATRYLELLCEVSGKGAGA